MHSKALLSGAAALAIALGAITPGLAQEKSASAPQGQKTAPAAFDVNEARRITPLEVKAKMDSKNPKDHPIIIDVRPGASGPIVKGAQHVTLADIETWAKNHPKDTFIVAYCT